MIDSDKISLSYQFENIKDKIVKELEQGKEINLKNTPRGLKVQVIKASTLRWKSVVRTIRLIKSI